MDKLSGGLQGPDDDLSTEQDDQPFGGELDDIEINFVDDENPAPAARRGQNEDPDFFEGDAGDEDDLSGASQAVRNRIHRERRLRMESESRLSAELERAEEAVLSSERTKAAAQRDSFKIGLDALDVRMQTAREALKQARHDDDRNAEVDIDAHMRQLEKLRSEIETNLARIPSDDAIQNAFAQHRERVKASRAASRGDDDGKPLNDLAHRWKGQNDWMDDPSKSEERKTLVSVSQQIAREGLDPQSPEHFAELTRRMAKSFPALGVRDLAGRQLGSASRGQPQNSARRASNPPPVGGNRGVSPPMNQNSKTNPRRVELDVSDKRMMRAVGIDPSDKKAVAYYAKEKLARVQRETRSGGR